MKKEYEVIAAKIKEKLEADYPDFESVKLHETKDLIKGKYRVATNLRIRRKGKRIAPCVDMDLLSRFVDVKGMDAAVDLVYMLLINEPFDFYLSDLEFKKENLFINIYNSEIDKELLKEVPHRSFQDMAIVPRLLVKNQKKKTAFQVLFLQQKKLKKILI
ncbi:MAG: DUF5688 family protein [Lachnospiraceae bacterium]|nr:DUF5688 family protein [Lachnospiraceae bacterium]